jgi:hypothetical protein
VTNFSKRIPEEFCEGDLLLLNELIPTAFYEIAGQFSQSISLLEAQHG